MKNYIRKMNKYLAILISTIIMATVIGELNVPPAVIKIGLDKQTSEIGNYCWKEDAKLICTEFIGIITPKDPLIINSPFIIYSKIPIQNPENVKYRIIPVTEKDELKSTDKSLIWNYKEGKYQDLPSKSESEINLSFQPGLYILEINAIWKENIYVNYGFLLKVKPEQEEYDNIAKTEIEDHDLVVNRSVIYDFRMVQPIYKIEVKGKAHELDVPLRIDLLKNKSILTGDFPGIVYKYFNAHIKSERINKIIFKYVVNESWIKENGILPEYIKLYQWKDSGWKDLDTKIFDRGGGLVYYESISDSLGFFAIATVEEDKISEKTDEDTEDTVLEKTINKTDVETETYNGHINENEIIIDKNEKDVIEEEAMATEDNKDEELISNLKTKILTFLSNIYDYIINKEENII